MAFILDDRPQRAAANQRVFQIYHEVAQNLKSDVRPVSLGFANSKKVLPLQGADMVAWEFRNYAMAWLKDRSAEVRPHFQRLIETGRFVGQLADRQALEDIAKLTVQDGLTS